jgi:hypothetical protein
MTLGDDRAVRQTAVNSGLRQAVRDDLQIRGLV